MYDQTEQNIFFTHSWYREGDRFILSGRATPDIQDLLQLIFLHKIIAGRSDEDRIQYAVRRDLQRYFDTVYEWHREVPATDVEKQLHEVSEAIKLLLSLFESHAQESQVIRSLVRTELDELTPTLRDENGGMRNQNVEDGLWAIHDAVTEIANREFSSSAGGPGRKRDVGKVLLVRRLQSIHSGEYTGGIPNPRFSLVYDRMDRLLDKRRIPRVFRQAATKTFRYAIRVTYRIAPPLRIPLVRFISLCLEDLANTVKTELETSQDELDIRVAAYLSGSIPSEEAAYKWIKLAREYTPRHGPRK